MAEPWPLPFRLLVDHVHDGDTIYGVLTADAGLGVSVSWGATGPFWGVRFYGINAPELATPDGVACRDYLETLVAPGDELEVESYGWDKYARRLDGVPTTSSGVDLCEAMLAYGHGVVVLPSG
jgi:endonuclease YncB( thermonuclease family)